jgi:alpha-N-arabinofuranosidase
MNAVQRIVVLVDEPIATINPYLHGHFMEHLGELIYPGVYVDPDGPIPNTAGVRNDVVAALLPLRIPILRWPGGCFADDYHWRDGIGPRDQRPMRINRHWGMELEPNAFGTHEFIAFCRALGAEPYVAGNVGSGTPAELRNWVEYCNFAGRSTLANERRTNGDDAPFGIRFWGIGNENWGCGGDMDPESYAAAFSRFRSYVGNYSGTTVQAIACGPNNADWDWTRRFFEWMQNHYSNGFGARLDHVQGFAAHYYCGTAGTATQYSAEQWLELLAKASAIEGVILGCREIMDQYDPQRRIGLIFDEWGAWHPVESGKPTGGLYQQNTIRDACVAALTLDIFHNHADKVVMANIAQLINVLQAVLLVNEDQCIKTPTYHVFDLYQPHKDAQAVRFVTDADAVSDGGMAASYCQTRYLQPRPFVLRAVQGSASIRDRTLCVTAVNTHPSEAVEIDLEVRGGAVSTVEVVYLSADTIHAHNTFEQHDTVQLSQPVLFEGRGGHIRIPLPAASIMRAQGVLG